MENTIIRGSAAAVTSKLYLPLNCGRGLYWTILVNCIGLSLSFFASAGSSLGRIFSTQQRHRSSLLTEKIGSGDSGFGIVLVHIFPAFFLYSPSLHEQGWDSRSKSDDTPVTKADDRADELIRTRSLQAYPDIPMRAYKMDCEDFNT